MRTCFDTLVRQPGPGDIDALTAFILISDLKRSELEKSLCGKRLLAWIDGMQRR